MTEIVARLPRSRGLPRVLQAAVVLAGLCLVVLGAFALRPVLMRVNANAARTYSLHTTGYVFDIARSYASSRQAAAFQFVLDRLTAANAIRVHPGGVGNSCRGRSGRGGEAAPARALGLRIADNRSTLRRMRGSSLQGRASALKLGRRTIGLGIAAAVIVTAAVVATFINHKAGGESKQRKAVSEYIQTVNLTQSQMSIQLVKVRAAYADLGSRSRRRKHASAELASADVTLSTLERRLVATPAPHEAAKLRSLLVKLVREEVALTRELHQLAVFTPRFSVYLARLRATSAHFGNALRAVPSPKLKGVRGTKAQVAAAERNYRVQENAAATAQADAIDAYTGALTGLLKGLERLHAPAVVAPAFAAEVRSLHDVSVTGARLSAALRAPKHASLAERIRAFTVAGREAVDVPSQRAQIASIVAYNRKSRAVGATAAAVRTELLRLGRELP